MLLQRSGEVVNSSGGHSLENGSTRHSGRRVGARNRKEEGFAMTGEGKSSRRGGGGGGEANVDPKIIVWYLISSLNIWLLAVHGTCIPFFACAVLQASGLPESRRSRRPSQGTFGLVENLKDDEVVEEEALRILIH
ncbi:hypothetical protein F2Q69_00030141 [Brassica cretica]|uniref:Uncharacterized protein n=1 Tax=Brassica cretica TaxID=69181 RepID=A0A8S9SC16_BRACR|nr:hypothetical protein F2Q69_00030141 [Brassica cretica]